MMPARAYLDHNATAPVRVEARNAAIAALGLVGNPSSVHAEGRAARAIVEEARENVARLVGAKPAEVVFTSGATEANNWAISRGWDHILVAGIEHDSVLAPAKACGAQITTLAAGRDGVVAVETIARSLPEGSMRRSQTLVALQWANGETGVLQPVAAAAAAARDRGAAFHCDAVQAAGRVAIDFAALGADSLSLSAHKIGGPKGVGALVIRDGASIPPMILGGGQERRHRAGTENVPGVAGFGVAAKAAANDLAAAERIRGLRDRLEQGVRAITPQAVVIGEEADRLCNTSCIALPSASAQSLVIQLDLKGIAVSAGSACSSGKVGASAALDAMGIAPQLARGAIRVSFGWNSSERELEHFLTAWAGIAAEAARRSVA